MNKNKSKIEYEEPILTKDELGADQVNTENYVTVFDHKFIAQGLCLYNSLVKNEGKFILWIVCVDIICFNELQALGLESINLINLKDVETEELLRVKSSRNKVEYIWTLSPFAPRFVFEADKSIERVTYIDADMFFIKSPQPIFEEFNNSRKSVLITSHSYLSEYDQSEKSGKYCVQFIIFKRNESEPIRKWWEISCINWCYQYVEDNKFGDQKYLDEFPIRFNDKVHILNKEYSIQGPWNAAKFLSKDCILYHFHGLRLINNRPGLILLSKGYKIPQETYSYIYSKYTYLLNILFNEGIFKWRGQVSKDNITLLWIKEIILFILSPLKIYRKPIIPRHIYYQLK